jgi:hypothetical protein
MERTHCNEKRAPKAIASLSVFGLLSVFLLHFLCCQVFPHFLSSSRVVEAAIRGLLCRCPPSGPISTNSLAPTSWKNPRPNGKDTFSRGRIHRGPSDNPTPSARTRQPFGLGRPAFGGNWRGRERPGSRAHRFGGVRSEPRGAWSFGARHRSATKDTGSHRGQGRRSPARARRSTVFVPSTAAPAAGCSTDAGICR